ncbi:MAG TPA: hypothetical protein VF210_12050 [Pseudomonadales bacterium]
MRVRSLLGTVLVVVAGCGEQSPAAPETHYRLVLDTQQLMNWVIDPSADVIWGSAGSITTAEGEQDLAPVDDEGWVRVRHAGAMLAESGNLLMLPGRSRGADWDEFAEGLMGIAERTIAAADARDDERLFELGGQLYNVCVACHQQYMLAEAEASSP